MRRVFSLIYICLFLCISSNLFSQEIFTAIIQRDVQKVNELLAQDSSLVSITNPRGFSPIHFAANFNQLEIAKSLLAYGADLNLANAIGQSSLDLANEKGNDLYLANLINGKIEDSKKSGTEINTEGGKYNALISPDGDYIIFTSYGYEDHYGGGDLYISFRNENKSWAQSINMDPEINSDATEYCPNVSPDGKYFFFTSNKKGTEDIYWIDAQIINDLKEKN